MPRTVANTYERLGAFYLGRPHDSETGENASEPLLYDAKDLTTHALCVGMTGSGKTGLCVSLLEEAAIDGIPAIAIDPKGDLGNLALAFPDLSPADFRPWVDAGEAARKGLDVEAYAKKVASTWRKGLAAWDQDGERVRRYRDAAEVAIYTPGSSVGIPLSPLGSFDPPPQAIRGDRELVAARAQASVAGLLALLSRDADPLSREATLLVNLLTSAWEAGRGASLPELIRLVQRPPFERLGVLDLETFFPARDRAKLALALNNLLASPGFAAWLEGEPLDIARLLHAPDGRPRLSVLSIAHLSDAERMSFVTLLLEEVIGWMRSQPGTSSLRAILYMDEIFGYFPPTAEPPSKRPMLTLLKQARAHGLGVVLATQNPVDLDYKGLSNCGTWFLGRLQTERDKARVLDGLEGALASQGRAPDRRELDRTLSGLGKRVFLLHNVHEDAPVVFHTRWAMSYLRGPLTRDQIGALTSTGSRAEAAAPVSALAAAAPSPSAPPTPASPTLRPPAPAGVEERFLALRLAVPRGTRLEYQPALFAGARLHHANSRAGVDSWEEVILWAPLAGRGRSPEWDGADIRAVDDSGLPELLAEPEERASFAELSPAAGRAKSWAAWRKTVASTLYRERPLVLHKCRDPKLLSNPGEGEAQFRARAAQTTREARDLAVEKLRGRIAPKLVRLDERIRKAEQKVDVQADQYAEKKRSSLISTGASLLSAFFGRKLASATNVSRAGTALRRVDRVGKEKRDVERAQADLEALTRKRSDLEAEFAAELDDLQTSVRPEAIALEELVVRPRKTDTEVSEPALVWRPFAVDDAGLAKPLG